MKVIHTDQLGRAVSLDGIPQRIVSLVPSQTELLHHFGLEKEVIGITKFCVHPNEWFKSKKRVGGTKDFKLETIRTLKPDLIIANKEENTKEGLEELMAEFPVWISDVKTVGDALGMIADLGALLGKEEEAAETIKSIKKERDGFRRNNLGKSKCVYLIWQKPYMTIGGDTFISNMLEEVGFLSVFSDKERYPVISLEEMELSTAKYVFLSSEPFPFKDKHVLDIQNATGKQVVLVDGEMFSWYGSRLLYAWTYFRILRKYLNKLAN